MGPKGTESAHESPSLASQGEAGAGTFSAPEILNMHPSDPTRMRRRMARPGRRSMVIPILFIAIFLYMVNRQKDKEDRSDNPTTHSRRGGPAQPKLRIDYPEGITGTRMRLSEAKQEAERKLRDANSEKRDLQATIGDIDSQLTEFKKAYKSATNGSPWPVPVRGQQYSENQLTSRVQSLLNIKEEKIKQLALKDQHITLAQGSVDKLSAKLNDIEAQMAREETKREQKRIDDLSMEADQWFDKNPEVTAPAIPEDTNPVRNLEDLIKADRARNEGSTQPVIGQNALNFLSDS